VRQPSVSGGGTERPKEVTGRTVLVCFVAFFAVVFGVNAFMVRAAVSTFGGVETESSYKAGLAYSREVAAARSQDSRHWRVDVKVTGAALTPGRVAQQVEITARDTDGRPLAGLTAVARFSHPTDRRLDKTLEAPEIAPGRFAGTAWPAAGQWDLVVELLRGGERVFLSKSRVIVKQG
jgi:nitrogen fixation protein FixH